MSGVREQIANARVEVHEPVATKQGSARPAKFNPVHISQLSKLQAREHLVEGLLSRHGMSVVYGDANCGKTFLAIDLGLHISTGKPWFDRDVRQGGVIYIAAEGGLGLSERVGAYLTHHGVDPADIPFWIQPTAVNLCTSEEDVSEIIAVTQKLGTESPVELIVIDTLARTLIGGNENSPGDMGTYVQNCDRIRAETGAHVLVIHHTGKDPRLGARGHSSLRGATDTELQIKRDARSKIITATVAKQRDGIVDQTFSFTLEKVEIGQDSQGKPVSSCVVDPCLGDHSGEKSGLTNKQFNAITALETHFETSSKTWITHEEFRELMYSEGIVDRDAKSARQSVSSLKDQLLRHRRIVIKNEKIGLPGTR